jgi:hypothetical protein
VKTADAGAVLYRFASPAGEVAVFWYGHGYAINVGDRPVVRRFTDREEGRRRAPVGGPATRRAVWRRLADARMRAEALARGETVMGCEVRG